MYGTSVYQKWIEKYGKDMADQMNEEFLNNHRRGRNNPMYGRMGAKHPSTKTVILNLPGDTKIKFKGHKACKKYLTKHNILGNNFSYHTLRQYSKKNKKYKDYLLEVL